MSKGYSFGVFSLVSTVSWADAVTAVTNIVIAVGIVFAGAGWLAERRKRAGEAVSSLGHEWDGQTFLRAAREALDAKPFKPDELAPLVLAAFRSPDSTEWFQSYEPLLNFFEDLGALEQSKAIRLGVIDSALGSSVRRAWHRWEIAIRELRTNNHQPTMYANFECLAMRLVRRDLRRISAVPLGVDATEEASVETLHAGPSLDCRRPGKLADKSNGTTGSQNWAVVARTDGPSLGTGGRGNSADC